MTIAGHKKKIFLVDDHPLVREWLTQLINQQPDLVVCGESDDMPAALSAMAAALPDLAIVDVSLKSSSGLELIKNMKELLPTVLMLVLSMHDESLYAERVLRAGARGYVNKRETAKRTIEAIRHVLDGKLYVNEKAAEALLGLSVRGKAVSPASIGSLSDRELEVFDKLGQGIGTRQIAAMLGVSIKTVEAYCARIKEKLGLASGIQLLREAIRWNETKSLQ